MDAGTGTKITKSTSTENKMMSYFFRAGYILKNRYLLTATLRADGASVFAKNNKWGYFPSVAAGWTMSEENFMRNIDWLNCVSAGDRPVMQTSVPMPLPATEHKAAG